MKRFKVRITDKNSFYKKFEDGTAIGGSYGEPIVVNLRLNKSEFDALLKCINKAEHDVALYNFVQSNVLSNWHRRLMCEKFKSITPERIKIEVL